MRAVVVRSFGGPEALEIIDVPVPAAGRGQVRVRVEAAAVNPVDLATRSGALVEAGLMVPREVIGIGWDVAGVVDATGPDVRGFEPGDRVIGLRDRLGLALGTYAEYVVLDASAIAKAPESASMAEAATLPLNGLTAVQALDLLALAEGETLLVTGAAGALGGFAVELATQRGLKVAAVAGPDDEELVRGLGAEWFISRFDDLAERACAFVPGGVHGALDAAVVRIPALDAVRNRGVFVSVIGGAAPLPLRGIRVADQWIAADGPALGRLAARGLTYRVADVYPMEDAARAHERLAKGGVRGRLVLVP